MTGYFQFTLKHRGLVIIACLLVTLFSAYAMSRAVMSTSLAKLILGDHPAYQHYVDHVRKYGNDEKLIVAFPEPQLGSPESTASLIRIVDRLESMPGVAYVDSPLSVARFQQNLLLGPDLLPDLDPGILAISPLSSGVVVSRDGRHIAVVVEMQSDDSRALERTPEVVEGILEVFLDEGYDREALHVGGLLAVLAEIQHQTTLNITRLTPIVALVLLAVTWLLFRRIWPVLIALLVGAMAIVWTMGFAIMLDRELNVLLAIIPALILIISFSDVIHLCSAYLLSLSSGKNKDEAVMATASEVGVACLYTSLTTLVGFGCLSLIPVPAFRQAGLVAGFGVAVALLLAMTLVPIVFSYMKQPRPWVQSKSGVLERLLRFGERAATARPWIVIGTFAVVLAAAFFGSTRIYVEADFTQKMSETNKLRRDAAYFDTHFSGTGVLDLLVKIKPDAEMLNRLIAFNDSLEAMPEVTKVISSINVLRFLGPLRSGNTLASYKYAYDGPAVREMDRLRDRFTGEWRFVLLTPESGARALYTIAQKARAIADTTLGPGDSMEPTGMMYLSGLWLEETIAAQRRALLISFAMITLMMIVALRSLSAGLLSMLPNVIPLLVLGGVLGFVWRTVDSDMALVALIAIGIAVDDTIHFLVRYRHEADRADSTAEAVGRTFSIAGRAIVMTSLIFAAGFIPFAFSDYLPIRMIGILLPLVMIVALLADVLLLPALITVGAIRFGPRPALVEQQAEQGEQAKRKRKRQPRRRGSR